MNSFVSFSPILGFAIARSGNGLSGEDLMMQLSQNLLHTRGSCGMGGKEGRLEVIAYEGRIAYCFYAK